jgi:hypothetical protein
VLRRSGFVAAAPAAILTAEFAIFDMVSYVGRPIGNDARLYLLAAQAWLTGGDPWSVISDGILFAGTPPTLLPIAPFAWLNPDVFVALVFVSSIAAALFIVRRLALPLWWLLFPPLVEALSAGSINIIVLALLLTRLEWIGIVAKSYAALPALVLVHARQVLIAAVIIAVTFPLLPWQTFFARDLADVLVEQAWGGVPALIDPLLLVPLAVVGLVLVGRARAAWWSIPALWPATQFHYAIFALPARPGALAAAILALPIQGAPIAALLAEAAVLSLRARRRPPTAGRTPLDTSGDSGGATSGA